MKIIGTSLFMLFAFFLGGGAASADESGLVFIVNAESGISQLSVADISDFFFKKKHSWPDETKVRFIDQKDASATKKLFNQKVLKKSTREIDLFWIGEKNFSGQSAPIQAPSDELVVSLVSSLPGSIGYLSSGAELDLSKVKRITIQGLE